MYCLTVPTTLRCVLAWSYPLHPLCRVLTWPPPPLVIRSLLCFREQQTSEAFWTFPVEWSQQPHDLINGDKHKPAFTTAALHANRDLEQVQPNKWSLQVLCIYMYACLLLCHAGIISVLWSFSSDPWHVILLCTDTQHALIRLFLLSGERWLPIRPSVIFFKRKCTRAGIPVCFPQLLFSPCFCRFRRSPVQPRRSRFTVQSGILINWPVL